MVKVVRYLPKRWVLLLVAMASYKLVAQRLPQVSFRAHESNLLATELVKSQRKFAAKCAMALKFLFLAKKLNLKELQQPGRNVDKALLRVLEPLLMELKGAPTKGGKKIVKLDKALTNQLWQAFFTKKVYTIGELRAINRFNPSSISRLIAKKLDLPKETELQITWVIEDTVFGKNLVMGRHHKLEHAMTLRDLPNQEVYENEERVQKRLELNQAPQYVNEVWLPFSDCLDNAGCYYSKKELDQLIKHREMYQSLSKKYQLARYRDHYEDRKLVQEIGEQLRFFSFSFNCLLNRLGIPRRAGYRLLLKSPRIRVDDKKTLLIKLWKKRETQYSHKFSSRLWIISPDAATDDVLQVTNTYSNTVTFAHLKAFLTSSALYYKSRGRYYRFGGYHIRAISPQRYQRNQTDIEMACYQPVYIENILPVIKEQPPLIPASVISLMLTPLFTLWSLVIWCQLQRKNQDVLDKVALLRLIPPSIKEVSPSLSKKKERVMPKDVVGGGLQNYGNSCYANVTFQLLFNTLGVIDPAKEKRILYNILGDKSCDTFEAAIEEIEKEAPNERGGGQKGRLLRLTVASQLKELFAELGKGNSEKICVKAGNPYNLLESIDDFMTSIASKPALAYEKGIPTWQRHRQQDAAEFYQLIYGDILGFKGNIIYRTDVLKTDKTSWEESTRETGKEPLLKVELNDSLKLVKLNELVASQLDYQEKTRYAEEDLFNPEKINLATKEQQWAYYLCLFYQFLEAGVPETIKKATAFQDIATCVAYLKIIGKKQKEWGEFVQQLAYNSSLSTEEQTKAAEWLLQLRAFVENYYEKEGAGGLTEVYEAYLAECTGDSKKVTIKDKSLKELLAIPESNSSSIARNELLRKLKEAAAPLLTVCPIRNIRELLLFKGSGLALTGIKKVFTQTYRHRYVIDPKDNDSLLIAIPRFSASDSTTKRDLLVQFSKAISLNSVVYELAAMVLHKGTSITLGHYTILVKQQNNKWKLFNDELVLPGGDWLEAKQFPDMQTDTPGVEKMKELAKDVYLLHYRKKINP